MASKPGHWPWNKLFNAKFTGRINHVVLGIKNSKFPAEEWLSETQSYHGNSQKYCPLTGLYGAQREGDSMTSLAHKTKHLMSGIHPEAIWERS